MTRWLRYAFGLPKSNRNSTFAISSPFLAERPDLDLEAPRVARLLIEHPVGVGDRLRPHQPLWRQVRERFFALARADALAHESGVDSRIDHEMRDVDILRPELARHRLRDHAQPGFRGGERGVADTAAQARGRTGKEDCPTAARQHQARGFAPGDEAGVAGHFPDLAEHSLGGLEDRKIDVRADVEDADFERRLALGFLQERGEVVFLARVERASDRLAVRLRDLGEERRELVAVAAPDEGGESFRSEFLRDCRADEIARAD